MDTQIDDIALRYLLVPLGEKILKELELKIMANGREFWFEIYLAIFILMSNFERIFADVVDYSTRHGLKVTTRQHNYLLNLGLALLTCRQSSSNGAGSLSKAYFHACSTLLVYLRFACQAQAPLALPWDTSKASQHGINPDQVEYMRDMQREMQEHEAHRELWRAGSVYRTPMYLCYRVISDDWSPDFVHSAPLDNFTEEDFLTS